MSQHLRWNDVHAFCICHKSDYLTAGTRWIRWGKNPINNRNLIEAAFIHNTPTKQLTEVKLWGHSIWFEVCVSKWNNLRHIYQYAVDCANCGHLVDCVGTTLVNHKFAPAEMGINICDERINHNIWGLYRFGFLFVSILHKIPKKKNLKFVILWGFRLPRPPGVVPEVLGGSAVNFSTSGLAHWAISVLVIAPTYCTWFHSGWQNEQCFHRVHISSAWRQRGTVRLIRLACPPQGV